MTDIPIVTPATGSSVEYPPTPEPTALPLAEEVAAARASLNAAVTVAQTKACALALDDLRGQQIAALTPDT